MQAWTETLNSVKRMQTGRCPPSTTAMTQPLFSSSSPLMLPPPFNGDLGITPKKMFELKMLVSEF